MGMVNEQDSQMGEELLGDVFTRSYGRVWKRNIDDEEVARLAVVGIGPFGARQVQMLSRTHPDLSCHEIRFDPQSYGLAEMKAVRDVARASDLLFIVSGFDDPQCKDVFKVVADSARESGVPIIGVVPDNQHYIGLLPFVNSMWPVSHRSFGGDLASMTPALESGDDWVGYALRHLVSTLTNIFTHKGIIGIDYDDVIETLKTGTIGKLAVGVASEQVSIADASLIALNLLADQGAAIEIATGAIFYLTGYYTQLLIEDLDATTIDVNERVNKGVKVIVGMQPMETTECNVMVTIMALSEAECGLLLA
uniref:Tubulin/FtsZ GTPase domain-containing protein n=1 Tax=Geobacter sp. (strain M21) TaxID=443144 RepID=C6E136_GEOSM